MDRSPGNGPTVTTGFYIAFLFIRSCSYLRTSFRSEYLTQAANAPLFPSSEIHIDFINNAILSEPKPPLVPCQFDGSPKGFVQCIPRCMQLPFHL